jgi:hypothetical protein
MQYFKLKKREQKVPFRLPKVIGQQLPKPVLPFRLFTKVHLPVKYEWVLPDIIKV